ncbi:membrane protein [Oceanicola sp. 22II-s10i]|uniref:DMT family transporter n=1 Tax=Oceanicola sp. 22II-s10i TaxID=1317116 RepID=UPI000B51EED2|nr:DMT family transporter [Oceanicola sp. 22II-s10i]OWU84644.1 membrane protein [Oceanicola sp. 22II-s10i]
MTDNFRGALLMMGAMALFTLNDTCTKLLSGDLPMSQIITLRGILTSVGTALIAWRMRAFAHRLNRRDAILVLLRTLAEVGGAYFFITALFNMPLANVTAVLQSAPLAVTLAAAVFLGEKVGWRRLVAIGIGFCGVLLIVRPGPEGFNLFAINALISVMFVTARDLFTRRLSRAVPSMLVSFATAVGVTLFFAVSAIGDTWVPLDTRAVGLIGTSAAALLFAYLCSVAAMRAGELSFVTPFRYTGLIWALLLGLVAFGDWPTWPTLLGAAIVVGSGLFMLYRERRLGLTPPSATRTPRA